MNETVRDYCQEAGVEFTRCRPYRKNDQAWVEQKNGAVVRRTVGYRRFEGLEAAAALARLYASVRLFVNFFQPSFKLAAKARDGAKVTKTLSSAGHAVSAVDGRSADSEEVRRQVEAIYATLDPVRLLRTIRAGQQRACRDRRSPGHRRAATPTAPTLEQFLSGLRTAWQEGEVRPTARRSRRPSAAGGVLIRL